VGDILEATGKGDLRAHVSILPTTTSNRQYPHYRCSTTGIALPLLQRGTRGDGIVQCGDARVRVEICRVRLGTQAAPGLQKKMNTSRDDAFRKGFCGAFRTTPQTRFDPTASGAVRIHRNRIEGEIT
jgi:hypothetical protein